MSNDLEVWRKIAHDWQQTAEMLAIELGKIEYAQSTYEDIRDGLYDKVRERMQKE